MDKVRVKASGPRAAKIAVVGMAPAHEEVRLGKPFVGASGRILNETLSLHGIPRDSVFVTNLVEFPITGQSVFLLPPDVLVPELQRLTHELNEVNPNVIIPLGNDPLNVLCGLDGITKWRGSIVPTTHLDLHRPMKCVPSVHPAWILRGMSKWRAVFEHIDLKRAIEESFSPELVLPERHCLVNPSFKNVIGYIQEASTKEFLSWDIESVRGTDVITHVGIGWSEHEAMCIPFLYNLTQNYWTEAEEVLVWKALAQLLQSPIPKVGQNLAFDWLYMWNYGIYPRNMYVDTMLLHHCLYPDFGQTKALGAPARATGDPGHSLGFITSQYTKTPYYKDDSHTWNSKDGDATFQRYNCYDVMVPIEAGLKMHAEAQQAGLWDFYQRYYVRPFLYALRMEWVGVKIDQDLQTRARTEVNELCRELQATIEERVGWKINVASPMQVKKLIYEQKGYQIKKNRKTGQATANKATLEYFARVKGDETLRLIVELRRLRDLKSDLLDKDLPTGRLHTHYRIGGTSGARWSSSEPALPCLTGTNLQNIPRKGIARELFIAD